MAYEMKPNTGTVFKNDKKTTDQHPNGKGSALIEGVEYWVSSWTNVVQSGDRKGEKYQAMKYERKDAQKNQPRGYPVQNGAEDDGPPF